MYRNQLLKIITDAPPPDEETLMKLNKSRSEDNLWSPASNMSNRSTSRSLNDLQYSSKHCLKDNSATPKSIFQKDDISKNNFDENPPEEVELNSASHDSSDALVLHTQPEDYEILKDESPICTKK